MLPSTSSLALPALTNKCGEKRVNLSLPTEADIIAYDKECTTAFVGPPSKGTAQVISATSSGNLSFCPSVKTLPNVVNKLMQAMEYWTTQLIEATNEALALEKAHDEKRAILIDYQEQQSSLEKQLAARDEELANLMKEIKDARSRLSDCQEMNDNNEACTGQEKELLALKKNYFEFRDRYVSPIQEEIFEVEQKARTLDRKLKQISRNIAENNEIFEGHKNRLKTLRNEAIAEYSIFGSLEGITAQIVFESKWGEQIEWAKQNNRYRGLHIEALPITKSRIHVDAAIISSHNINMPSTLMYASIPGFVKSGITDDALPSGDNSIDNLDADISPNGSLISGVSGKIVLSLIGACPLTDDRNKLQRNIDFRDLSSHITVNTINEYPMLHARRHKVTFKTARFAEEIEKRTEKGGFFHTSSIKEIIKENFSDDDFKVEFEVDPTAEAYTQAEKTLIKDEAKKEIVDRVLKEIGVVHELSRQQPPVPARLKQSGAGLIYAEAPCFGWAYCYAAKFIIGTLDSIFGKKEALTTFKVRNQQQVTYSYSDAKPATYSFVTTFSAEE
jgi:hypothetical protein